MRFPFFTAATTGAAYVSLLPLASAQSTKKLLRQPHKHAGLRRLQTSSSTVVTYPSEQSYSTPLLNPERGFYTQESYRASSPQRLDAASLASHKESSGQSLLLRLYYLDAFLGGPIASSVLDDVEADFASMRAAGVKCILRFAYTDSQSASPTDAPESIVLNHISQLTPILTANQDAILAVQAGFVGPWGEWHGSSHFDGDDGPGLEGRRLVVQGLLNAVPDRNVQIRTPKHKQLLYATAGAPAVSSSGHVTAGDFEGGTVTSDWSEYMDGYDVWSAESYGGSQSIKVVNGAAKQNVYVTVEEGYVIQISGVSKRVDATGSAPYDYSIYADVKFTDGSYDYGQLAKFSGEDTWNESVYEYTVPSGQTVQRISLYCMYRNANDGYALFDDVAVTVYEPASSGVPDAVDFGDVIDGSNIARTGHHNDCFLASDTDYGTYEDPYSISNTEEYDYLSQETKHTSMGGETCNPNSPRSDCPKAKEELALFHYTYLNSGYNQDVLDTWISGGCMDEVAARLGYRLLLKTGSYGNGAPPGGTVPYSLQIENVGYSSPVNTRPFQLVLREVNTGSVCAATDGSEDVRAWFGGETHLAEGNLILPADMAEGTYNLFLNLADESANMRTDLDFKIKAANIGLNDGATGMIDLQHSVTVAVGQSTASSNAGPGISIVCGMEGDVLPPETSPGPVQNGGFEGDPSVYWDNYGANGYTVDTTHKHSGYQSVKITNGGARQSVNFIAEGGSQVTIRGHSKAVGTSVGLWDYGIYADVSYSDGTNLWGQIANFPGGTHDFTLAETTFTVPFGKTVDGMNLYALYRNDAAGGVAYFDDVSVTVDAPLVINGGFEGDPDADWSHYGNGYTVDTTHKHSGNQSVKITDGGAKQSVTLNAEEGSQVTISGYSKAVGTSVGLWDYGLYADVKYSDGSSLWGQIANFPGGTHDFTYGEKTFVVPSGKTVTGMSLYAMYRDDPAGGEAYFDDVSVTVQGP